MAPTHAARSGARARGGLPRPAEPANLPALRPGDQPEQRMGGGMFRRIAFAAVLGILASPPARAGVVISFKLKEGIRTLSIEGNRARIEEPDEITIIDGDAGKLVTLNPRDKTYTEMTPETMRAQTTKMKSELEEMKARLTPEQRAQVEAMTKGGAAFPSAPKPTLVSTGRKEKVAGHTCEVYRYAVPGGVMTEDLCLVPWGTGLLTKADAAPFVRMAEMYAAALEEMSPGAGEQIKASPADLASMPGFPVRTTEIGGDGKPVKTESMTKFSRGPVPGSAFAIPAGYKKVEEGASRARRHRAKDGMPGPADADAGEEEPEEHR